MGKPRITVTQESETGRNTRFHDNRTGRDLTRPQLVREIRNGNYSDYYVREINGLDTPVAKPDGKEFNNLD